MIRVLHIIGSLNYAGAETFLISLYRNIDKTKVQFDFAIYEEIQKNSYCQEVKDLGGNVFLLPTKSKGIMDNMREITKIVKVNQYNIVWRHSSSAAGGIDLIAAKLGGARRLIMHAHSSSEKGIEKYLHYILKPIINGIITDRIACGKKAGNWMYGKKEYVVVNNAIDIEKYSYNEEVRNDYRKRLNLENKLVLGHVANFSRVKNQKFLLNILKEVTKIRKDTVLVLVGDGELKKEILEDVKKMELQSYVIMLGKRIDVNQLMQMFDIFLLPSFYEGFPMVLVEAQTADLPCIVSNNIPEEVDILGKMKFLSIADKKKWVEYILNLNLKNRKNVKKDMQDAGFDMKTVAKNIEKMLCKKIRKL